MKTVNLVEFGCAMKSDPQPDDVANDVVRRLRAKGIEAYVADLTQAESLEVLQGLRPVAGTDADFDYTTGKAKS